MLEAFPLVTAWRGSFWSRKPVLALIGLLALLALSLRGRK